MSDLNDIAIFPVRFVRWILRTLRMFFEVVWSYASALRNPANIIIFALICAILYFYVYLPPWEQPDWLP